MQNLKNYRIYVIENQNKKEFAICNPFSLESQKIRNNKLKELFLKYDSIENINNIVWDLVKDMSILIDAITDENGFLFIDSKIKNTIQSIDKNKNFNKNEFEHLENMEKLLIEGMEIIEKQQLRIEAQQKLIEAMEKELNERES